MIRNIFIFAVIALCISGCGVEVEITPTQKEETPTVALQAIIKLYEARDFDALIRTRYAEIGKAETEEQIQQLIDRFASRFEADDKLQEAVAIYKSILLADPALSEDGTTATFTLENGSIKLTKMENGNWGFHL